MAHILYLASQSAIRQQLLKEAGIPFLVIPQHADETAVSWKGSLPEVLLRIVELKKQAVQMPLAEYRGQKAYVLTVDSMPQAPDGTIMGKPKDQAEAVHMLVAINGTATAATAYCVELKQWDGNHWKVVAERKKCITAKVQVHLPPHWRERYMELMPWYLSVAGAMDVMEFGAQFLSSVKGSYGAVLSLPLFEIRKELESLGFYE
jgi:septum formation protein